MQFFTHNPLVAGLKLFWERVTFSRLTKIYFIFSVLHCIIQVVFQVQAFVANAEAVTFLNSLIVQGNATDTGFAVYDGDLRMCESVPNNLDSASCTLVWDGLNSAQSANDDQDYAISSNESTNSVSSSSTGSTSSSTARSSSAPLSATISVTSLASSTSASATSSSNGTLSTTTVTSTGVSATTSATTTSTGVNATASPTAPPKVNLKDADESDDEEESESSDSESDEESDEEEEVEEPTKLVNFLFSKRDDLSALSKIRLALNGTARVDLGGLDGRHEVDLPRKCLYTLNWPADNVANTKREDVAFIAFQFWLLGMSLVALMNESIPHIVASLLTHILATAWGAFQIFNTEVFHRRFTTLTTKGACGINLLPHYWKARSNAEIPSMALNGFALLVSAFLSWRLMKTFGWQTFKRVGASRTINRVYNLVLMLSIAIQLSLFFVGTSAALWIDQVYNGNIGRLTHEPTAFKAVMITVLVLLVPWLSTGWISVRKEYRTRMLIFLVIAVLVLVGWAAMFIAPTFRWTYVTWLFFSLMTSIALALTTVTLILGSICRINFGKGLTRYLNAQEELIDSPYYTSNVEKVYDSEKFAFPSDDKVPTYSVTFGSGQEVPPPSQMRFTPRSMGPRFHSGSTWTSDGSSSNPFVTPTDTTRSNSFRSSPTDTIRSNPFRSSPTDTMRSNSLRSSPTTLSRHDSRGSQMSTSSANSAGSAGSSGSPNSTTRRWVIE